jgi:hypothetical protein
MLRKRLKPASLPQQGRRADVRFGSKADIRAAKRHVRFTPESGHSQRQYQCPLWAKSGHWRVYNVSINFFRPLAKSSLCMVAHIREMVFQAGLDTVASRLNICAIFFDVRSTRVPDGTRLYQRKLAPQRKKSLKRILMHATRPSPGLDPAQ